VKWGVIVFPGSNCDHDAQDALGRMLGQDVRMVWHKEPDLAGLDGVMVPGGFSYGDYLRAGAIARFSPVMEEVIRFAQAGRTVLGVCNGFQVLTEAGLLPGALLRNTSLRFICEDRHIRVERDDTRFTHLCQRGEVLRVPIAHNEGNYHIGSDELKRLEDRGGVLFRYCTPEGEVSRAANPNGSTANIAGVINERGNVLGMMPHPERRCDPILGHVEGRKILESMVEYAEAQ
jgi:phosphoribosylformylglycinamidine synthase